MNTKLLSYLLERSSPGVLLVSAFDMNLIPEVAVLKDVVENKEHHPEGATGIHMHLVMDRAFSLTEDKSVRLAAFLHDVGKAITGGAVPSDREPQPPGRHVDHDGLGKIIIEKMFDKYKWPSEWKQMSMDVAEFHIQIHQLMKQGEPVAAKAWDSLIRRVTANWPEDRSKWEVRMDGLMTACQADAQGRLGRESTPFPQRALMQQIFQVWMAMNTPEAVQAEATRREERAAVRAILLEEVSQQLKLVNPEVKNEEIQIATSKRLDAERPDLKATDLHREVKKILNAYKAPDMSSANDFCAS